MPSRVLMASIVMVALLAGCAPARIPLEATARQTLPSASVIHVVTYPTDPPPLITAKAMATGAMFGPFGGAVVGARAGTLGKELMEKHKVPGLSEQLVAKLSEDLTSTLPNLRAATTPASDDVDTLKKAGLQPLVLDVRSGGMIMYYASSLARYRLIYAARVRLVDTERGRVLWLGTCDLKGDNDDASKAPTLDEIEAEDGVVYRRLLADQTAACAKTILEQFRGAAAEIDRPRTS